MILRKLASNAAYLTLDWFSITILSSLFWIVSGKLLSSAELGVVSTSFNLATVIQFFTILGVGAALSKLISEYSQNRKEANIAKVTRPAIKLVLISNLFMAIIMVLFLNSLSPFLKLEPQILLITTIIAVLLAFTNVGGFMLLGFQAMRKFMLTNMVYHVSKVFISALLVLLGLNFFGPLIGVIIGLFLLFIARYSVFEVFSWKSRIQDDYKEVLKYSIPALIGGLSVIAFNNVPYITLTVIQDLSITGIFTPAMLLATPLFVFPFAFTSALFPIISGLSGKSKQTTERKYLINVTFRYAIFLTLPLAIFLIFFSEEIIPILFTQEYLQAAQLLKILATAALIQGLGGIFLGSIYAMKKPQVQQNILLLVTIMFISLSLPLTYLFSAIGMAIAYFTSALALFSLSFFFARKLADISLPYKDLSKIFLSAVVVIAFILFSKLFITNLFSIFLIIPSILVYFFSLYYLNFYSQLDLRLLGFLSNRAPRFLAKSLNFIHNLLKSRVK